MRSTSLTRALEAMAAMEKGRPYALRPEDAKRRLAEELARLCRLAGVKPVVIGGLAVNHHGYMRVTADVDILVSRQEAVPLYRRLKAEPGWRRHAEGFKNTVVGIGLDICVEGERTAPGSVEEFPSPATLRKVSLRPLPVPALSELIALKVMSGRARDDADVVELLKRHRARMTALRGAAAKRLKTKAARERLTALLARAREEAARGR
ncbi:MAG TPA: hypothetical protein VKA01_01430 [Vicinamibacteria bacterium]|nr:hypothetical protein [Vicinamibacteria bacterium]